MSLTLQITRYPTSMLPLPPCHRDCCNCCSNYYYYYHYLLIKTKPMLISPPSPSSHQNSLANYGTSNRMFELSSSQFVIGLNQTSLASLYLKSLWPFKIVFRDGKLENINYELFKSMMFPLIRKLRTHRLKFIVSALKICTIS